MNLIIITNLFPNPLEPHRSTFNFKQIKALSNYHDIIVVSPISWLTKLKNFINRKNADVYNVTEWQGINVRYPSYFYIPGLFRFLNGFFMYYAVRSGLGKLSIKEDTMVIGTWLYPDSFASALLAKKINKKCIIKVHGSDVEEMQISKVKRMMSVKTLKKVDAVISVSKYLSRVINIYYPNDKTHVIYNGIDKNVFNPVIDESLNSVDKLTNFKCDKVGLFVGNLKKDKGIVDLINSLNVDFCKSNCLSFVIIGAGVERKNIEKIIESKKISAYVKFLPQVPANDIAVWMKMSSFTCLPSYHEGLPNVLLESIACGTPVISTDVGGISEIVNNDNGILIEPGNINALQIAITEIISINWNREKVSRSIEFSSWNENVLQVNKVIEKHYNEKNI